MRIRLFILLLLLAWAGRSDLAAQEYLINLQSMSVEEGFSNRNFYHPFQDSKGFIWVGTGYGLDRYDGTKVKHFPYYSDHGLRFNRSFRITEDEASNLWLHYQSGLQNINWIFGVDVFDPILEKAVPLAEYLESPLPFPEEEITWVTSGSNGTILLSTLHGEVYAVKSREISKLIQLPKEERILQLHATDTGDFWVLLWEEMIKFSPSGQELKRFAKSSGNPVDRTDQLNTPFEDEQGRLHYSASLLIDPQLPESQHEHFVDGKPVQYAPREAPHFYTLAVSPKTLDEYVIQKNYDPVTNALNLTLLIYSKEGVELGSVDLGTSYARDPYFDRQNNLWFVHEKGLHVVSTKQSPFRKYIHNFISYFDTYYGARGIIEDGHGNLLVSGLGRSYKVDKVSGEKEVFGPPFLFNHPFVGDNNADYTRLDFARDGEGKVWMSDESFRLLSYDIEKDDWEEFTYPLSLFEGLDQASLRTSDFPALHTALMFDKEGSLWLGHNNGLSKFNKAKGEINWLRNEGGMAPLKGAEVIDIYENDRGLWLSTTNGIFLFDPKREAIVSHYHLEASGNNRLPHNSFTHLYEDQEGIFWLASRGGGLVKWWPDEGRFQQFTTAEGLSNNVIYAVYEDADNNLWLPSDQGINQFNKLTGDVIHYQVSDGIAHTEFNTISHYRGEDSTLYFGGLNGISAFHPKEITKNLQLNQSPLVITDISKQNKRDGNQVDYYQEFSSKETIVLQPSELGFSLDFSHLDYTTQSDGKQYAYKIAGVDADWVYQTTPTIRINALPYGEFELQLKAQESNGRWTDIKTYPISVLKPFYLQTWFILLFSLVMTALVVYIVRRRISALERHKAELEKEVAERTAEIKEQNVTLERQTQELEKQTVVLEKQATELKQLDSAKSQFFANISHELRTPLTLIMGPLSELLKEKTLDEEKLYKLKRMYRSSKGLSDLVEEILELSKLEAGKLEVHESPVLLMHFLKRLYSGFESFAVKKGVNYSADFYFDDQIVLSVDPKKVEKIINNLLSNALKFTDRGGYVKIMVRLRADVLKIIVKDSGRGISEKDLPFVFDRFFQTQEKDLATVQGGTGIGLALVKELTEVMKGTISVQSEAGLGTTFEINLPKKIVSNATVPKDDAFEDLLTNIQSLPTQTEQSAHHEHQLLVVEDNPDMQEYVARLLKPHYQVKTADNGMEALETLKAFSPDLIISDVMMPEMDGFTLLKRLKSNQLFSSIPVVMLTARAEQEDKLNALTIGVDDYLTKPFHSEELLARVQNLLAHYSLRKEFIQNERPSVEIESDEGSRSETSMLAEVDLQWVKSVEKEALGRLTDADFSIESLAEHMHLSRRQFLRKIKAITGLNSTQYLQELRLRQSRDYLERGAYHTVAEVSYAVGFQSTKYFSKLFKSRFGKSPSAYLAQVSSNN